MTKIAKTSNVLRLVRQFKSLIVIEDAQQHLRISEIEEAPQTGILDLTALLVGGGVTGTTETVTKVTVETETFTKIEIFEESLTLSVSP